MYQQRRASFAESMASMEENNVPFDKALALSAGVCGETSMATDGFKRFLDKRRQRRGAAGSLRSCDGPYFNPSPR